MILRCLAFALCSVTLLAACDGGEGRAAPAARILRTHRPLLLRTSFQLHAPCDIAAPDTSAAASDSVVVAAFAPLTCAPPARERMRRVLTRAARERAAAVASADSSALFGRLELLVAAGSAPALERAVAQLQRAVDADSSPALLNDLGVALAARAVSVRDPFDLLRATEAVLQSLRRDSAYAPALYNRALLLQRLALTGEAAAAWAAYEVVDRRSAWTRDIPAHTSAATMPSLQTLREDSARLALHEWSVAQLADDARASVSLERARVIGAALRDRTIADAVAVIARAGTTQLRTLAHAHVAYERGEQGFGRASFTAAAPALDEAALLFGNSGSPFLWWTLLTRAGVLLYEGRHADVAAICERVLTQVDPRNHPAIAARAHWIRGVSEGRLGRFDRSLTAHSAAAALYRDAGEAENIGANEFLSAQALAFLGQSRAAATRMLAATEMLARHPRSPRLHDHLLYFGRFASGNGLYETARALHREGLHVAARTGRAKDPAEVRVRLAQTALDAGATDEAASHLDHARDGYASVEDTLMRARGRADIMDTESALWLHREPARAVSLLAESVDYFAAQRNVPGTIRALTRRSAALRAERREEEAARDLDRAIALYEQYHASAPNASARAALQESAAAAYDAMIVVQLALNRSDAAFAYLMRSRGATAAGAEHVATVRGAHVLAYAVLPDELVLWTFTPAGDNVVRVPAPATHVQRYVDEFIAALQSHNDADAASAGAALFRMLLEPVWPHIPQDAEVVLVPDRVLGRLPFAALREPATGTHFIERARLSIYTPGRHGGSEIRRAAGTQRIFVANGADFDRAIFPDLPPLPAAGREAAAVRALYSAASVVTGEAAAPAALMAALRRSDVMHFAGHARALPATPELSYLVTAADGSGSNRVTAQDIARLDLDHVSLVVLSACSSAERGTGRSGAVNGLAQAFLFAGAGSVVASVWDVDDEATAELLVEFHRGFRDSRDARSALRAAQLKLLRSADPQLRAPAAWAGFQHYAS